MKEEYFIKLECSCNCVPSSTQHNRSHPWSLPYCLFEEEIMLLMPLFQTITRIFLVHLLLPLRPTRPRRLRPSHNANHLIRHRQLGVDRRRERMNQLRPLLVPQPQHGTTVGAEVPLRRTNLLLFGTAGLDRGIFPFRANLVVSRGSEPNVSYNSLGAFRHT